MQWFLHQHSWFLIFLTQHSNNSHRGPRDSLSGKGMDYNFWHGLRFLVNPSCSQRASICSNFQDFFYSCSHSAGSYSQEWQFLFATFSWIVFAIGSNLQPVPVISIFVLYSLHRFFTIRQRLQLQQQHPKAVFGLMPKWPGTPWMPVGTSATAVVGFRGSHLCSEGLWAVACLCWVFWVKVQADMDACSFMRVPAQQYTIKTITID